MQLKTLQAALEAYLSGAAAQPGAELLGQLRGSAALSAADGLRIYHNAYRARLLTVLREDFPALHRWLGDAAFEQLALAYIAAWPPRHFSLRWLGERLPAFIGEHVAPPEGAPLRELATLEWAFTLAFDAQDAEVLSAEGMGRFTAADWTSLRLALAPSVNRLELRHTSLALWQAAKAGGALPDLCALPEARSCLIWRQALVCRYRSLEAAEAAALALLVADGSFATLCEALFAEHGDQAPLRAATWLRQWVDEGLLVRVKAGM